MSQQGQVLERDQIISIFNDGARKMGWVIPDACFPEKIEGKFFPDESDLFKALEIISPADVRYVILGLDPYFRTDENGRPIATGVAFGVKSIEKLPSGSAIFKILKGICGGNDTNRYKKCNLEEWASKHGILLLNAALTVPRPAAMENPRKDVVGRHLKLKLWDRFVQAVVHQIPPAAKPIAWGKEAQAVLRSAYAGLDTDIHAYDHPSSSRGFANFWSDQSEGAKLRHK